MGQTVYLIDDIVAAPGKGREVLETYRTGYAPAAEARGMKLEKIIISPPMWLDEASNRLTAIWTVEGAAGWWGQAVQSRYDPGVGAFWQSLGDRIVSRTRHFGGADADVEALSNV